MTRVQVSIVTVVAMLIGAACANPKAPAPAPAPPAAAPRAAPAEPPPVAAAVPAEPAGDHEGGEIQFMRPATYAGAVTEIDARIATIAKLIDDGQLAKLHQQAAVIRKVADGMSRLVAAKDSGVPASAYPEVLKASRTLSDLFTSVDEAGDSGNVAASRKAQADLEQQAAILRKYAPSPVADFTCPMHPEVSSPTMGKCPKCGMDLEKRTAK